ncbi:uncharacterized protein KGF55_001498 [Candida pseudojiufengensis]|uniref:uncharacterized protein n=1 Tax=Candida pseudojiufengensis TaxID=497109 RepID=UPI002225A77B|nr:uncharacterized protein KGF55_001498 [Candida pseudojiufengensis]KAI5965278.1 hypothetical protein KGF55_001498 [Candida pseudojiufengensis]
MSTIGKSLTNIELPQNQAHIQSTELTTSSKNTSNDVNFPIKLIDWSVEGFTYDNEKITTPILLQEKNGPCPLIALVNTILLQFNFKILQFDQGILSTSENQYRGLKNLESLLLKNYNTSKKISLNDILSSIGDLLLIYAEEDNSLEPEIIDQLLLQLPKLHTGLDVNPNLITGDFELNLASTLFHIFGLVFKHGWVIGEETKLISDDDDNEEKDNDYKLHCIMNELKTFDKIQDYLFLEHPNQSVVLNQELIRNWLDLNCTQLTDQGLKKLDLLLESSQFIIFFRNNHFNTLFKKSSMEFYLLVTDSNFSDSKNKTNKLIWQSLNSINGENDLFFTGDFMPVLDIDQDLGGVNEEGNNAYNDHLNSDLLLTRQLQEEEDANLARSMQNHYKKKEKKHSQNIKQVENNKPQRALPNEVNTKTKTPTEINTSKKEPATEKPKKKKLFSFFSK